MLQTLNHGYYRNALHVLLVYKGKEMQGRDLFIHSRFYIYDQLDVTDMQRYANRQISNISLSDDNLSKWILPCVFSGVMAAFTNALSNYTSWLEHCNTHTIKAKLICVSHQKDHFGPYQEKHCHCLHEGIFCCFKTLTLLA